MGVREHWDNYGRPSITVPSLPKTRNQLAGRLVSISPFFATAPFSHKPTSMGCIAGRAVLTGSCVRYITSPLSWHPVSAGTEHGAKLPQNPASMRSVRDMYDSSHNDVYAS